MQKLGVKHSWRSNSSKRTAQVRTVFHLNLHTSVVAVVMAKITPCQMQIRGNRAERKGVGRGNRKVGLPVSSYRDCGNNAKPSIGVRVFGHQYPHSYILLAIYTFRPTS